MIDKNKQYKTRSGFPVEIYATDRGGKYPVHGAICSEGVWHLLSWTKGGCFVAAGNEGKLDLVEVKPRIQLIEWFNVYRDRIGCGHKTRAEADASATLGGHRVACIQIPIDCEEGDGL